MTLWQDAVAFVRLFPEAALCGTVMAAVCSVCGVFVVLKRIVFISIALSEAATCGLALALVFRFAPLLGASLATAVVVLLLTVSERRQRLPKDVLLGLAFLLAASVSVLLVSRHGMGLEEIQAMLYGDLIVSGPTDRRVLLWTGLPATAAILLFLRPILGVFLDREAAEVMGLRVWFWEGFYFFLLGTVISGASKSGGALLVFCLLVVVPATALLLARRVWAVLGVSAALGVAVTWAGLLTAYRADLPANPTIITLACLLLSAVAAAGGIWRLARRLLAATVSSSLSTTVSGLRD